MVHRSPFRALAFLIVGGSIVLAGCGSITRVNPVATPAVAPTSTNAAATATAATSSAAVAPTATQSTAPTPALVATASAVSSSSAQVSVLPAPGTGAGIIADVTARVRPGVVQVTNEQLQLNQLNEQMTVPQGVGSGIIFDASGHVLTNNHVVAGAQKLDVTLPDGTSYPATLIGRDPRSDIAVIQIQGASNLPVIPLGDSSKVVVGQWVIAIGDALALPGGPTVTSGVVSALGRTIQEPSDPTVSGGGRGAFLFDLIQTDAAINPGNSGGPLVNLDGQVIGMNTLGAGQAQAINFAIAINTVKPIADQLIKSGKVTYAYLGIGTYDNTQTLARRFNLASVPGVIVTSLAPQGPAMKAGLQQGDVMTTINGSKITGDGDLLKILNASKPGDVVTVTVARPTGQPQEIKVTLGEAPSTAG